MGNIDYLQGTTHQRVRLPRRKAGVKDFPHSIIVYTDWRDRNLLLDKCLAEIGGPNRLAVVLTTHPRRDSTYFKARGPVIRGRGTSPKILDATEVCNPVRNSDEEILSLVARGKREARAKKGLFVSDLSELFYDRYDFRLALDETEASSNQICCYRREGFWSLDPKYIAKSFHQHGYVFTDSGVLHMTPHV